VTASTAPFGVRLQAAVAARGSLCVGIDPHPVLLQRWGLADDVAGLERFCRTVVDAVGDEVAVVKPQSAFFERFGSGGIAVLERVLGAVRGAGALALLDVKRGDIGSTAAGYAAAYLDPASPLAADAITVNPYLGFGSLAPVLQAAASSRAGVFVLALTSNPEGAEVQQAVGPDGRTVAQRILDAVAGVNAAELAARLSGVDSRAAGGRRLGSTGVVVGATLAEMGHDLSRVAGPVLAPGIGAQGATIADLPRIFGPVLPDVLPAVSREVLAAGPDPAGLREAVARLQDELRAVRVS
jgi:orotidine-5'-phosphate decarboxylase